MKLICRTVAVATCLLITGCQTHIPRQMPETLKSPTISRPGSVFIPATTIRDNRDALAARCLRSAIPEDPIISVQAPAGYGLDDRYIKASQAILRMGTGCLGNDDQQCRSVVEMAACWSDANASIVNRTAADDGQFWNDTLTVNLYVARPFIGAYSIARARGFSDDATDLRIKT